jgi:para-nitrobenzyl esterase
MLTDELKRFGCQSRTMKIIRDHFILTSNKSTSLKLVLGFLLIGFTISATGNSAPATVKIDSINYEGVVLDEAADLYVFRGLPYAAPPVGDLRWQAPQANISIMGTKTSENTVQADSFSPRCPQSDGNIKWYQSVAAAFGNASASTVTTGPMSEDCLYLNVWTNNLNGDFKLPVMVWIHGGSNRNGWAFEPNYLGHNLAAKNVVVVSINYRLGIFGFLAHPELSAESSAGISGNYGLLDQIAALKWVQERIALFGGDPNNVTLFGESAGAADIAYLMISPMANGLFRKAISQSGGYLINSTLTLKQGEKTGLRFAAELTGLGEEVATETVLEIMRKKSVDELLATVNAAKLRDEIDVVIDGKIIPDRPARMFSRGEFNKIDLLIGTNANEWYMYVDEAITQEGYQEDLLKNFTPLAAKLAKLLPTESPRLAMDQLYTASNMLCTSKFIAASMARKTPQVFTYQFSRVRPGVGGEKLLAYHGAEIPYVFDTHDNWLPTDKTDRLLTEIMGGYWIQFANTGNPNADELPYWPAFGDHHNYLDLGNRVLMGRDLESDLCDILAEQLVTNIIN